MFYTFPMNETSIIGLLAMALAIPALVVMATGGGFGAAVLAGILCLPISLPVTAGIAGAAAELFRPKP